MSIFARLKAKQDRIKHLANRDIYDVLTIAEVCAGWHRHYKTVELAIKKGNIVARKSGKAWIVSYRSVVAWWGDPIEHRPFIDLE